MTTLRRQVKNMVKNYSEAEVKVREATSNDPWGPSSTLMSEISDLTYNIVALGEVMRMIWKRLNDHGKNWRHVYKSLVLLDYLIKNGNEKVAQQCKEHIVAIQTLKDFVFLEEQKDQGQSVREKAKQLVNLLRDDDRLKQERTKAFKARERFAQNAMGISSDNKLTYATSVTPSQASSQNRYAAGAGRAGYADPYGGAGAGATAAIDPLTADLEAVRPSDTNEEELQIKLAMMLSQQEHEEEVQRKRTDDVKLTMALEQSKTEGQPNGLVDLADSGMNNSNMNNSADPWASSGNTKNNNNELDSGSDEFFPPLYSNTVNNNNNTNVHSQGQKAAAFDPWSSSNGSSELNNSLNLNQNGSNPWQNSPSNNNMNNGNSVMHQQLSMTDPWAMSKLAQSTGQPLHQKADDFDLFTTDRAVNQSPLTAPNPSPLTALNTHNNIQTQSTNLNTDPFGDFFGNTNTDQNNSNTSTNPWNPPADDSSKNKMDNFEPLSISQNNTSNIKNDSFSQAASQRKTPESFLGENSSLVNLENLIPTRPKSTNPFGANQPAILTNIQPVMQSSNSSGQLNNPFLAQQALQNQNKPTISQLQNQQKQQQISAFPSFGNQAVPAGQGNGHGFGQLPQPLIPPSNSIPNMAPLGFNQNSILAPTPPPGQNNQANFNAFNSNSASNPNQNSNNPFLMM